MTSPTNITHVASPPKKFFSQFVEMDCDRGSPHTFCNTPNGNYTNHQPLTSAHQRRDKTNSIITPTDFRCFFNNQENISTQNCLQASETPVDTAIHSVASTPLHAASFLPKQAQDSLSSIRFSSRLHLTRTPSMKRNKTKRTSLSLSRTPRAEADVLFGSSTSISPSPGPWVIEDSRRRMSFGATTMGDLSDISDDSEDEPTECEPDPPSIPLLQEYDTQSSCTSSFSSRASPWKTKSKWSRYESLSQDTGLALLEEQYNESEEEDDDDDMMGCGTSGNDIDMDEIAERVDQMKRACPQLMTKREPIDVSESAYKQLKISDFFQPKSLDTFSMSCGQLPRYQEMEVSTPPRSRLRTRSFGNERQTQECVDINVTLSAADFRFETHSFQISSLSSSSLLPVVHGTGTLRSEASVWMSVPSHGNMDVVERTPPPFSPLLRCRSSPPMTTHPEQPSPNKSKNETKEVLPLFRRDTTCCLPVSKMTDDGCRCIEPQTMVDLLCGKYEGSLDHFVVIDCRFTYEFMGGHVKNALHIQDRELLGHLYSANKIMSEKKGRNISWVFYCEFSQQRAPETATWFRKHDRTQHMEDYPNLSFPDVYILEGGFSRFWRLFSEHPEKKNLFSPNNYVSMWDREHEVSLKHHTKLRKELWSGGKGARKNKLRQRTGRSRSVCAGKRS